jgi:SNF2 family DNA or RNA helicase
MIFFQNKIGSGTIMLNLRKLKQDFSSNVLKEGKALFDENKVVAAKILHLDSSVLRINAKVLGQYNNTYESQIEIDRMECQTIDSDCDCPYHYDCQHLAALLFYLEANLDSIIVEFSKDTDLDSMTEKEGFEQEDKEKFLEAVKVAVSKQEEKRDEQYQKELLKEYIHAAKILAKSPFFLPPQVRVNDVAEPMIVFLLPKKNTPGRPIVEIQIALRLPSRSKPLHVPCAKDFLEGIRHQESFYMAGKNYLFSLDSFDPSIRELIRMIVDFARVHDKPTTERGLRSAFIEMKSFGMILAKAYETAYKNLSAHPHLLKDPINLVLPCLYEETLEAQLKFSVRPAQFNIGLEYLKPPSSKILLNPTLVIEESIIPIEDVRFLDCANPGMLYQHVYYRFDPQISRLHLLSFEEMREITIPEPLFGAFLENSLSEVSKFAEIKNREVQENFVTMPFVGELKGVCQLSYLDGELEADLSFKYDDLIIPSSEKKVQIQHLRAFITEHGILARDLVAEKKILDEMFLDFTFNEETGTYVAKSEKKIIEFMTDVVPKYSPSIEFDCPQNLLDQFIYDQTTFSLNLEPAQRMDQYIMDLKVDGHLSGIKMDRLWECLLSKKAYIELDQGTAKKKKATEQVNKMPKILVLDLLKLSKLIQLFDELGIDKLSNHKLERPLWSLANIDGSNFIGLPVMFEMTDKLVEIRRQMLGEKKLDFSPVPKEIKAELRSYQLEGVQWLERLRKMYLSGILADDMGLGKTLQAIVAISQNYKKNHPSLIVCPTSLLYNWKEEISRFNPQLKAIVVDGIPTQRKKMIESSKKYDVIITSYSLLQKDIEFYEPILFAYTVLDEAQHIKNRGTRNAKSVKMIQSEYRMILSGTPIENSLDELWSLFDFLMPGFLGSYERFVEKYIRVSGEELSFNLNYLKKKVAPFILRRMKSEVLNDLPPVSEITYRCYLSPMQQELYRSYAASARDELVKLVARDGFDKVQIHVLATLTRLKQICCHPAIFAKENPEANDSAKYDMLLELIQNLVDGQHKTVIFSQYTKMLQIMRKDFEELGIRFVYLDGSSKNRLEIVKQFNEDEKISVFLVSLKAGGTGLNLVGADTVIHYDMWWNPAVENQATDRVHRMGQKQSVSVYKLVTMSTIEEKIVEMQKRKQGIVKKVVSCDEEAMAKLTWEDVLELLQG